MANQIGNLFIEENLRTRENHAEGTSAFIEEQLEQAKKTLMVLEAQVEEYKLKHKGELPEQETSLAGALSRAQIELQANQDAIDRAGQSKALLSTSLNMAESTAKVLERTVAVRDSSASAAGGAWLHSDRRALQAELDALRLRYTEEHPDVQRLEKMVAQARQSEKAARPDAAPAGTGYQRARSSGAGSVAAARAHRQPAHRAGLGQPRTGVCAPPSERRFWARSRLCKAAWIRCPCANSS